MNTQQVMSKGYLVWYIAASLVLVIALGSAMEGKPWWQVAGVLAAYVSLVWGSGCFFCRRARAVLQQGVPESNEPTVQQPTTSA